MHKVAPAMIRSPRHAPCGAAARPDASAAATPSIASSTPKLFRALSISMPSARKSFGVLLAMLGVAAALASGLAAAPQGAWRGDLIMAGATLCMALYNVWSRPFIGRSSALGFVTAGMAAGAAALVPISLAAGGAAALRQFGAGEWLAALYL